MARLRRRWRVAKWLGLTLSLLIVVAWVLSLRWTFGSGVMHGHGARHFLVQFAMGEIDICDLPYSGENVERLSWWWWPDNFYPDHVSIPWIVLKPHWDSWRTGWFVKLPLWIPFLCLAIPTGLLHWHDYRIPRRFFHEHDDGLRRIHRRRRMIKWAGVILSAILFVIAAVAWEWTVGYTSSDGLYQRWGAYSADGGQLILIFWIDQGMVCALTVPLWIPFVLVAASTAFLCWRDRHQVGPQCCQSCGYNLTGNVSGTCPECGRRIHAPSST